MDKKNFIYRKIVHISFGLLAYLMKILGVKIVIAMSIIAIVHNAFIFPLYFKRIFKDKIDWGIILYPASVLFVVLLYVDQPIYSAILWAVMAFGDGFAGLFGRLYGKKLLPYSKNKTIFGTAVFVITSFVVSLLAFLIYKGCIDKNSIIFSILISVSLALIESLSLKITDNLLIMIGGIPFVELLRNLNFAYFTISNELISYVFVLFFGFASYFLGLLNLIGVILSIVVGVVVSSAFGLRGFLLLFSFFVLSYIASFMGRERKKQLSLLETKRTELSVLSKGFFPFFFSIAYIVSKSLIFKELFIISLSSAVYDTVSGEVGKGFSKSGFKLFPPKKASSGEEGVFSFIGIVGGISFTAIFLFLAKIFYEITLFKFFIFLMISVVSNFFEPLFKVLSDEKKFTSNILYIYVSSFGYFFLSCLFKF